MVSLITDVTVVITVSVVAAVSVAVIIVGKYSGDSLNGVFAMKEWVVMCHITNAVLAKEAVTAYEVIAKL